MKKCLKEQTLLGAAVLGVAGIAPNIFPIAQAGFAKMSTLGTHVLLPSLGLLVGLTALSTLRGHRTLVRRIGLGAAAGVVATIGLEIVRITSFRLGGMPGDLPRLMGVLLSDRFMYGPSAYSDVLGWAYHVWNGAVFGMIFVVPLGRRPIGWFIGYGILIGVGFLASPVVSSMGIGPLGAKMPSMPFTVIAAHIVYGWALGALYQRWSPPVRAAAPVRGPSKQTGRGAAPITSRPEENPCV